MSRTKKGTGRYGRFGHFPAILLLFLAGLSFSPTASAACTQEMAEDLIGSNLNVRIRFLKNEKRMPVYEAASAATSARVRQRIAEKDWDGTCREVFGMIAIADDVLAGGDGKTQPLKKPWEKCTPEKMFSLAAEYDMICKPERRIENCARRDLMPPRRELASLKAQAGRGDMKAVYYMNRTCELYTELLRIINQ